MSRHYNIYVEISKFEADKAEAIKTAACKVFNFDGWSNACGSLSSGADGWLCGGETEDEFAQRLAVAVWRANGKACYVAVTATYLEDLPCETYNFDEEDYERLINEN